MTAMTHYNSHAGRLVPAGITAKLANYLACTNKIAMQSRIYIICLVNHRLHILKLRLERVQLDTAELHKEINSLK